MRFHFKFLSTSILLLFACYAAANAEFKQGQVVVYGKLDNKAYQVEKYLPNANLTILNVSKGKELATVKQLKAKGKKAHINLIAKKSEVPNDPLINFQWQWHNISAYDAWDKNTGANVTVAVLDTGITSNPADGISCIVSPYNVYNGNFSAPDGDGHGTHVAGTIAQQTNNNVGVVGLAYDACVMPVKVLDDSGSGGMGEIADGIYYAVNNGAKVINMSLGINARFNITSDPILDPALAYANDNGVTLVAASGNDGNRKNISFPSSHPLVISVGATDFNNNVTSYSNKGSKLDLVAPGGDTSADRNGDGYADGILQETDIGEGNGYYFFQGTSMAAPHVSALSAMLISHGTATTPEDVKTALTSTTTDLYESGWDKTSGAGLINASLALDWVPGEITDPIDPTDPPAQCTDLDGDGVCAEEGDCDDDNASIFPGANDSRGKKGRDNIDNDCNGIIDG